MKGCHNVVCGICRWGSTKYSSCWRHRMEIFSMLLALCEENPPVTGRFLSQRPVTWGFDVFFDLRLNKRPSKQSSRRSFETALGSLWRYCNVLFFTVRHSYKIPDKAFEYGFLRTRYIPNFNICFQGNKNAITSIKFSLLSVLELVILITVVLLVAMIFLFQCMMKTILNVLLLRIQCLLQLQ